MRAPVYRNLDQPFQILGFTVVELTALCCALVGGGELAQAFSISRIWSFLFTVILALSLFWMRHSLGDLFRKRLLRFLQLPVQTYPKLLISRKSRLWNSTDF